MGVRGLNTFFNENADFFKPHKLHDSPVIFDGDNLIHALYFSNKIGTMFGGDYKKYADSVRRYLLTFLECNINPIIIFDGGIDKSGRKLKTIFERAKCRLSQVKSIAFNGNYYERILPILARDVFLSVLVELKIVFAVCDYEADDQITALANYYKCPVISADSDFYIYDVHEGFIRVDYIDTTINVGIHSDGTEYKYLNCYIYHIDEFVSYFPGIDKNVLPLFGTLIGNDYVDGRKFNNFFSNIQLPKYNGRKLILNSKQKKMIGLLCWLKNNTLSEAVSHIMLYLKKNEREYIKSIIEDAVSGYNLRSCNLTYIIDKKLYNFHYELRFTSQLITPCGNSFPLDFLLKFHSGEYSSFFVNTIVLHKIFLNPQIEDISLSSSYKCSRFIRRVMYGILVRHDVDDNTCQNEECLASIEENDRHGTSYQKQLVEPIFSIEGVGILPKVNELHNLKEEKCIRILTKVLGISSEYFSNFPHEWKLLFGCFNYWLHHSEPHCTEPFMFAIVINLIYFSIIKRNCFSKDEFECPNKKCEEVPFSCSSVRCIISKISESEIKSASKKIKKYVFQPAVNHGNPLLMYIIHSYSQLQSCIENIIKLNKLLGQCIINPAPQKCFSGTMLYNLTKDISTRSNAQLFIAELLGRETALYVLFTTLISKIYQNIPHNYIIKDTLILKKHKNKKHSSSSTKTIKSFKTFNVLNRREML